MNETLFILGKLLKNNEIKLADKIMDYTVDKCATCKNQGLDYEKAEHIEFSGHCYITKSIKLCKVCAELERCSGCGEINLERMEDEVDLQCCFRKDCDKEFCEDCANDDMIFCNSCEKYFCCGKIFCANSDYYCDDPCCARIIERW